MYSKPGKPSKGGKPAKVPKVPVQFVAQEAMKVNKERQKKKKQKQRRKEEEGYFAADYGRRLGAEIGEGIQSIAKIFGFGAYKGGVPKKNTLFNENGQMPYVSNPKRSDGFTVRHREYIGELTTGSGTPSAFTLQSYSINPGNPAFMPWAHTVADGFEEYEINGMVICLKSEASEYASTLSLGSMFGAVQYDSLAPAFTNKAEVENYEYSASAKPSETICIPVECARKNDVDTHLYVATGGNIATGSDPRLYNLGVLYLGSQGCPSANAPIAEIWVDYQITFYKPKLGSGGLNEKLIGSAHLSANTYSNAAPIAASAVVSSSSTLPITFSGQTISIPAQTIDQDYFFSAQWTGSVAVAVALPTVTLSAGASLVTLFVGDSQGFETDSGTTAAATMQYAIKIPKNTVGTITLGAGTLPTTPVSMDIFILEMSNNLIS